MLSTHLFDHNHASLFLGGCEHGDLEIVGRDMRSNYWYLNIYILWLNTLLNIVLPITSLIILNVLVCRYSPPKAWTVK